MKKIYSFLLMMAMTLMSTSFVNAAIVTQGDGWYVDQNSDTEKYTLIITDTKATKDYSSASAAPWNIWRPFIDYVMFDYHISGTRNVGSYCFCDMPKLTSMSFTDVSGNISIGAHAFENCTSLSSIWGDEYIISFGDYAFKGCTSLWAIDWNDGMGKIGAHAFEGCTNLELANCHSIAHFSVGEYAFSGCKKLPYVDLKNATNIGQYAFSDCPLVTIDLSSCKQIGERAFRKCSLKTVTIGSAITSIGNYAFMSAMMDGGDLYMQSNTPPTTGSYVFDGVNCNKITLHVPSGAQNNYKSAPWSSFIPAERDPEIYGIWDNSKNTLTLYYGDPYVVEDAKRNWMDSEAIHNWAVKIIIDPSVAGARPTSTMNMFSYFTNVTKIEGLQYLNTSKATTMLNMFAGCYVLEDVDGIETFNTTNVTTMKGMFANCGELTELDLTYFDMTNVTNTAEMFSGCEKLETIYCDKDWEKLNITTSNYMFYNCPKLVGAHGAKVTDKIDKSYARPDGGALLPGYFTNKAGDAPLPVLCEGVTANGDFEDIVIYQEIANFYKETGIFMMYFSTTESSYYDINGSNVILLDTREDGYVYVVGIEPESLDDLRGMYEPAVFVYEIKNGTYKMLMNTEGTAIIDTDEDSQTYTLVLNVTMNNGESFNGVIAGICADIIPAGGDEGINQVTDDQMRKGQNAKILRDGHLLIEHNGRIFNAIGTQIR